MQRTTSRKLPLNINRPSKTRLIRQIVLHNIGIPDNLIEVQVKQLWNDQRFRVNVYLEIKNERRLAYSYFLQVTPKQVFSNPPMTRITSDDILATLTTSLGN